jgi:hypothetical protein
MREDCNLELINRKLPAEDAELVQEMPIWQQETLAVQRLMPGWCDVGFKVVV